ncbi:hypothetical protein LCGC14_2997950, partial [marine sediment metagenome]
RGHFELAKDPFGGEGQVWRGTHGAHGGKKIVAINSEGFFVMPDRPELASVRIRLAVHGGLDVKVVVGGDGKFFSFHRTLPAAGRWCDLDLPLSAMAGRVGGGTKVVDITVMHKDPSPAAALYVHSAVLVAN